MAPRPLAPLRLQLSSPADGTRVTSDSVTVAGSVSPPSAASVLVVGQRVALTGGTFSARVAVQPGSNIIDVLAGAPHARATMTAVRVYRLLDVTVPDLSGDSPSAATRALHALGLQFRFHDEDGFFDFLLPNSPQVCGSSPPAGRSVEPGSVVTLSVAKTC
jgi:bacillopeptidase F